MGRLDDDNKRQMIQRWRIRTGAMIFAESFRDSKTKKAEEWMREKPYQTILKSVNKQDNKE